MLGCLAASYNICMYVYLLFGSCSPSPSTNSFSSQTLFLSICISLSPLFLTLLIFLPSLSLHISIHLYISLSLSLSIHKHIILEQRFSQLAFLIFECFPLRVAQPLLQWIVPLLCRSSPPVPAQLEHEIILRFHFPFRVSFGPSTASPALQFANILH